MQRKWAVNASPLILLVKTGLERLLCELSSELVVPRGVATELAQGPSDDPARRWLDGAGTAFIRDDVPVPAEIASWDLGAGETAVLTWTRIAASRRYLMIAMRGTAHLPKAQRVSGGQFASGRVPEPCGVVIRGGQR